MRRKRGRGSSEVCLFCCSSVPLPYIVFVANVASQPPRVGYCEASRPKVIVDGLLEKSDSVTLLSVELYKSLSSRAKKLNARLQVVFHPQSLTLLNPCLKLSNSRALCTASKMTAISTNSNRYSTPSLESDNEKSKKTGVSKETLLSPDFNPKHLNLIVQEGIILGAGAAAILLQVAETGVGQGVNQHSNFAYRVSDRLRTTMTFVYCMSYGTPEEKRTICDMIDRVHSQVSGTLEEGRDKGKTYSALDPDLQMWVAATLYATAIPTYEKIFGTIEDEVLQEEIYHEYSILAAALQVPPEMWPPTRKAFWEYWDHKINTIEVGRHAKEVAADLLTLRRAPFYLRIFMPGVRVATAELLPERMRREFGVNYHPKTYKLLEFVAKATYRPLPLSVRSYPARMYMKDMRKRLKSRQKVFEKAG